MRCLSELCYFFSKLEIRIERWRRYVRMLPAVAEFRNHKKSAHSLPAVAQWRQDPNMEDRLVSYVDSWARSKAPKELFIDFPLSRIGLGRINALRHRAGLNSIVTGSSG